MITEGPQLGEYRSSYIFYWLSATAGEPTAWFVLYIFLAIN